MSLLTQNTYPSSLLKEFRLLKLETMLQELDNMHPEDLMLIKKEIDKLLHRNQRS